MTVAVTTDNASHKALHLFVAADRNLLPQQAMALQGPRPMRLCPARVARARRAVPHQIATGGAGQGRRHLRVVPDGAALAQTVTGREGHRLAALYRRGTPATLAASPAGYCRQTWRQQLTWSHPGRPPGQGHPGGAAPARGQGTNLPGHREQPGFCCRQADTRVLLSTGAPDVHAGQPGNRFVAVALRPGMARCCS